MTPREILAANLNALMKARPSLETNLKVAAASEGRLSNGKLGRVRLGESGTSIDTLGDLADTFGLEPWQLLVDGLKPNAVPGLTETNPVNQELERLIGERFSRLSTTQKTQLQGALLGMLLQFENASQSADGKVKTRRDRSGLGTGHPKRVKTTSHDLKSLRETTRDVSANKLSNKSKARPGSDKKA